MKLRTLTIIAGIFLLMVLPSCNVDKDNALLLTGTDADGNHLSGADNSEKLTKAQKIEAQLSKTTEDLIEYIEKDKAQKAAKLFTDNAVLTVIGDSAIVPLAGVYNGSEKVEEYFSTLWNSVMLNKIERQYNLIDGYNVNAHVRLEGFVPATLKTFDIEFVYVLEFSEKYEILKADVYYCTFSWETAFTIKGDSEVKDIQSPNSYFNPAVTGTKEVVDLAYGAFGEGNIEGVVEICSEDMIWILKGDTEAVPYADFYEGQQGVRDYFFRDLLPVNSYQLFEIYKVVEQGNRIDYIGYEECTSLVTGEPYSCYMLHSFIVDEEGNLLEFKSYNDSSAVSEAFTQD